VVSVYEVNRAQFYGDAGLVMSSLGEASIGVLYRWVDAGVTIGPPGFPAEKAHEGALTARLVLDSRDNPFIPVEGAYVGLDVVAPLEALNSEEDHAWVTLDANWFLNLNRQTFWVGTRLADSLGGEPTLDFASLGGFNNLSGFAPNQLLGRASSLVQVGYHFQAKEIFPIVGSGVYLGGVLEAGNVGDSLEEAFDELFTSVAAFVAINTNYGPIYLGAAKAEVADWQYYLTIGQSF